MADNVPRQSKGELQRLHALLDCVRKLKSTNEAQDDVTTRTLSEVVRKHGKARSDNIKSLLCAFHWDVDAQQFQMAVNLSDFEAALVVVRDLCLCDDEESQPQNSSSVSEPVDKDRWICAACTYANHEDFMMCEICQTPRRHSPRPTRLTGWQAELKRGSQLDLLDCENEWIPARIKDLQEDNGRTRVFVHYEEWDDHWDEWIELPSKRLSEFGKHKWHYRFPAGFHKSKRWAQSVYSHLPKPKVKRRAKKKGVLKVISNNNNTSNTSNTNTQDVMIPIPRKTRKSTEESKKETKTPKEPTVIATPSSSSPSSSSPPCSSKSSSNQTEVFHQPPKVDVIEQPEAEPEEKQWAVEDEGEVKDHMEVEAEAEAEATDEWDMCDEFGIEMLKCTVCGRSSSASPDFLCGSCDAKEIQDGYAIVIPNQKS